MSDYITTREYAALHNLNIETVKARKPKADVEIAKANSRILHVEIQRAYYVAVVDNSGKEITSDFTFLSKAAAEKLGVKMKKEIESRGEQ